MTEYIFKNVESGRRYLSTRLCLTHLPCSCTGWATSAGPTGLLGYFLWETGPLIDQLPWLYKSSNVNSNHCLSNSFEWLMGCFLISESQKMFALCTRCWTFGCLSSTKTAREGKVHLFSIVMYFWFCFLHCRRVCVVLWATGQEHIGRNQVNSKIFRFYKVTVHKP